MTKKRGINVDHSTTQRQVVRYKPQQESFIKTKKDVPADGWWLNETHIKIKGQRDILTKL